MNITDFLDAVGRVDRKYVEECIVYTQPKKMNSVIMKIGAVAASFAILITALWIACRDTTPVIIEENGFYIKDGVLLNYEGTETDVFIPDAVETIADFAFLNNSNAEKIETIRLGADLKNIENNAFAGLNKLTDIVVDKKNTSFIYEDGLLLSADGTGLYMYTGQNETRFKIPDSVISVAAHAVQATELEEIDFGTNLKYIGYNAFSGNTRLKAIYLPDSVKVIFDGAFSGCSSAVDGYIPQGAKIGEGAFEMVPFYLSIKAGHSSPLEDVKRGDVSPSEAIVKSNIGYLTEQIDAILSALRGENNEVYRDIIGNIPKDIKVPEKFSFDELKFADKGWGMISICDLQIFLSAGEYTIIMEAYAENLYSALYWKNICFEITRVYYLQNDISASESITAFGWTAVFEKHDGKYCGITYIHEDGRVIKSFISAESDVPYTLIFSPEGKRVAVEYKSSGKADFYIQSLNGDVLMEPAYDYKEYFNRDFGQYKAGSLKWTDEDNVEGENEYGGFKMNIFEYEIERAGVGKENNVRYLGNGDLVACLYTTVSNIEKEFGELTLEYSEHGPGQPVYSVSGLPGVLLVFHGIHMDEPLSESKIPSELIILSGSKTAAEGALIGKDIENFGENSNFYQAEYSSMDGAVYLMADGESYTVTYMIAGDYSEQTFDSEKYISSPEGEILSIRITFK
ncbi:MAG: leucine-rich repeat domain-containing protein [Ruminococcaceae bacterium]|nr:leucine-rich repeat domain-containing protein [Oscillospiraceae bacterium]